MRFRILIGILITGGFLSFSGLRAQTARDTMRAYAAEGWKAYVKGDFSRAEYNWRNALHYGKNDSIRYDLGESVLLQKRPGEALNIFLKTAKETENDSLRHRAWHNIGNIYFHKKQYEKAVEAYKNALRANPDDEQTRYNYALAELMLKKQRQKQKNKQNNNNNNRNKNNKNNKNNKDKQNNKQDKNQDKNRQNKDKRNKNNKDKSGKNNQNKNNRNDKNRQNNQGKNKDNKDKQKGDKNKQNQKKNKDNQPQNPNRNRGGNSRNRGQNPGQGQRHKSKLKPSEAMQLLRALKNKEKQTLKKINARRARGVGRKTDKDW